ncbi:FAD dependent oxidoreductase-domain-containing protein [Pestalotiopsis sp. NC0098]|nr:FAD dependent oxidoreductase-domain-containing protein [Pestalotiopsis sp. NC0098]
MAAKYMTAQIAEKLITGDPGVPSQNPTQSYWQHIPHRLAETQSPILPKEADIVVIGSGITGASVTKTLLEANPSLRVVIFEARTLCSGATGRNGGQLATNAGEAYARRKAKFGTEQAGKIANFTFRTCDRVREVIKEYAQEESEYRDVMKVRAYLDDESFKAAKAGIEQMESDHPSLRGIYEVIDGDAVQKLHGVHGAKGGVTLTAGVLWPYRVVTSVFSGLLSQYSERLSIETNTPVTSITHEGDTYAVQTARGTIRAKKVVHCTNGYLGHLVPGIRGLIYPLRGTMTVQDLGQNVPNRGREKSFAFHHVPKYDDKSETLEDGLYYLTQNAKTGYFFFGGEKATMEETLNADDSVLNKASRDYLQNVLPASFGYEDVESDSMKSAWSGIMGFTHDEIPLVGKLPASATGRTGDGEFAAAGFNGFMREKPYVVIDVVSACFCIDMVGYIGHSSGVRYI